MCISRWEDQLAAYKDAAAHANAEWNQVSRQTVLLDMPASCYIHVVLYADPLN